MPAADALSVSPTRAVPAMTGSPSGAVFASSAGDDGPATRSSRRLSSFRPSPVHTAPLSPHARPAASTTVTVPSVAGSTSIRQPAFEPRARRRASVTVPPVTSNAASRSVRKLKPNSSLKCRSKPNAACPSWLSGTPSTRAVSAASTSSSVL